ncbi:MAG TPA: hypothetical protein VHA54_03830 [Solirubrobacterales bacterium]|nr:hypothetical protein [Solirubrobacterales bacterium]
MTAAVLACSAVPAAAAPPRPPQPPPEFFGIGPQEAFSDEDAAYMAAGGIGSVRWPFSWSTVQPTATGGYHWEEIDAVVATAARHGLRVLPFLYGTPGWVAGRETRLPVDSGAARSEWTDFLQAAVERYGPGGEFWRLHSVSTFTEAALAPLPIRTWQIWNEANFHYFAYPVSPRRYAKLLAISTPAIKAADPGARVVLAGLFGEPTERGARGMPAVSFLEALYRVPSIARYFDAVAVHPYAASLPELRRVVSGMRRVVTEHHDDAGLYVTEMGWGSQDDYRQVAFEQGAQGQARALRGAYRFLLAERRRLHLMGVYWFSWKDLAGSCDFCDSVGLFDAGAGFVAKPAWRAFVGLTGGSERPAAP